MKLFQQFWTDESGQGLTEYASIVALVSIGLMLVLIAFRNELGRIYNEMTTELNDQVGDNIGQVQPTLPGTDGN